MDLVKNDERVVLKYQMPNKKIKAFYSNFKEVMNIYLKLRSIPLRKVDVLKLDNVDYIYIYVNKEAFETETSKYIQLTKEIMQVIAQREKQTIIAPEEVEDIFHCIGETFGFVINDERRQVLKKMR